MKIKIPMQAQEIVLQYIWHQKWQAVDTCPRDGVTRMKKFKIVVIIVIIIAVLVLTSKVAA